MAIHRLIAAGSYEQEEIRAMTEAYDIALIVLRLSGKDDPITEQIAKSIAAVVATGERRPGDRGAWHKADGNLGAAVLGWQFKIDNEPLALASAPVTFR